MSWLDILNKNNTEFQVNLLVDKEEVQEIFNEEPDYFIKNVDEEFEKIYNIKIIDIKFDFKEYIQNEQLPFMNKTPNFGKYDFYDFIKNNCKNYYKLSNNIDKENKKYLDSLKDDEHDFFEEFKENNYENE